MNRISLSLQRMHLKSVFPSSIVKIFRNQSLEWIHILKPSPFSNSYKVKLIYILHKGLKFYVLEPKLKLREGENFLPHVYSTSEQRLCLYYPDGQAWNASKLYVDTIIPWACEWLLFYELWLATGEWYGGGVCHTNEAEKKLHELEQINNSEPNKQNKN